MSTFLDSYKRKWTQAQRDRLPTTQFAGPDQSYPIATQDDVQDAWDLRGHAEDPDKVGRAILRIANKLGLKPPKGSDHEVGGKSIDLDDLDDSRSITEIAFGNAVKVNREDPYKLERSYLVLFTTAEDPDLSGEYFTAKTDYGDHRASPIYYDHGLDTTLKKSVVGSSTLGFDAKGVWIEGQLDKANKYAKDIAKLAAKDKLGWSSGTASHLVERKDVKGADGKKIATEITKWPLGIDASLTPTPCEPRTRPDIMPIKSYVHVPFKSLMEGQEDQFDQDEPLTDQGLGTFAYSVNPLVGHSLAAKVATEHSGTVHSLYRNRTISTPEYKHIQDGFTKCIKDFHDGLDDDVAKREMPSWDSWDLAYKAIERPGMKTVGDALHGSMTRAYNAGADHMLTRGHVTRDEHKGMRDQFETCRDAYLAGIGESVKDRTLKDNGSAYVDIKSLGGESGRDSTLAGQVEDLLAETSTVAGKADRLHTRLLGVKTLRADDGKDLGPAAAGHIADSLNALKALCASLESLLPVQGDSAAEKVKRYKAFLAESA